MKSKIFNYLLFPLLFLSICCISVNAQDIKAETKLQQYTIRIGDQTKLFLIVHQPAAARVNFPKLGDTITGKVQVVGTPRLDTAYDDKTKKSATVTESVLITSFDAGTYTIPALSFGTARAVIKSNELTLQVQTVKVDTTKGIYDIKQPLTVSYTFFDWLRDNWYWIVIPILLVAVAIWLFFYFKNKKKKTPVIVAPKPALPAHVLALDKLRELRDRKLWQNEQTKEYYIELSEILREYLEKRYLVKTHEKTTDEIFTALKHMDLSGDNKNMLQQILVLSDLVKFAKEKPLPAENELSIENAMLFITRTQQSEQKINTEGGSSSELI